jgi:hypothetical protein
MKKREKKYKHKNEPDIFMFDINQLNIRGSIVFWELTNWANFKKLKL